MKYLLAYYTDKGRVKKVNQDSILIVQSDFRDEKAVLAVICDGIGGLEQGEWASAKVRDFFDAWFQEELEQLILQEEFEDMLYDSWEVLLQKAHRSIKEYGCDKNIRLGTTATAMLFWRESYYIAHIGDCRIYEIQEQITQLTKDQVRAELRTEDRIKRSGKRNEGKHVLLQGVGASDIIRPAYYSGGIKENTVYLMCTDGFWNRVMSSELYRAFEPEKLVDEKSMVHRGEKLAEAVMERGEKDNISFLLIRTIENKGSGMLI